MNTTLATTATGQRDINRFSIQTRLHLGVGQGITARSQRVLDLLLGGIDDGTLRLALVRCQLAQAFHLLGDLASLAKILGLGIFQCGGVSSASEVGLSLCNELV